VEGWGKSAGQDEEKVTLGEGRKEVLGENRRGPPGARQNLVSGPYTVKYRLIGIRGKKNKSVGARDKQKVLVIGGTKGGGMGLGKGHSPMLEKYQSIRRAWRGSYQDRVDPLLFGRGGGTWGGWTLSGKERSLP